MRSLTNKTILSILIIAGLGMSIGYFTAPGEWFKTIAKPSWQPPNWVFGPVWTILYIMIGIAFARVWHAANSPEKSRALKIFGIQFLLNLAWSPIFFLAHDIVLALADIVLLLVFLTLTILAFRKVDKLSALLLVPYFAWVLFATALNATILLLN